MSELSNEMRVLQQLEVPATEANLATVAKFLAEQGRQRLASKKQIMNFVASFSDRLHQSMGTGPYSK